MTAVPAARPGMERSSGPVRSEAVRLAVLMPVHRDQEGLERSLGSLFRDGANFDIVVVDDGSTPPLAVPEPFRSRTTLLRLDTNLGITGALNAGLGHIAATGYAYVARLDAGDLSLPGRMAAQMGFLDAHPDHAMVGCAANWVDLEGSLLYIFRPPEADQNLRRFQHYRVGFMHSAVMMRVAALEECGFYDDRYNGAEDYELFVRLSRRHRIANLPDVYIDYEINPNSLSSRRFRQGIVRLRVQMQWFDPWSVHAYLGVARNVLLLFATRGLILGMYRRVFAARGLVRRLRSARRVANDVASPD